MGFITYTNFASLLNYFSSYQKIKFIYLYVRKLIFDFYNICMLILNFLYLLLSFLLAISTLILGIMLAAIHIPDKENMKQYNSARYALAFAYLIIGVFNCYKIIISFVESMDLEEIYTLTLVSASYQALLFTFALLTLIQPLYVSLRRVILQFGIISVVFITLLLLMYNTSRSLYSYFYYIVSVLYVLQLIYYVSLFRKKHAQYLKQLEDYYDEEENNRLKWVKSSFYMALSIGIMALSITYLPLYCCVGFIGVFILFYVYFAIKYSNYPFDFQYIIPAVYSKDIIPHSTAVCDDRKESNHLLPLSEKEQKLQEAIDRWVEEKQFLYTDMSRDDIAQSLGTDRDFLALFFQNHMKTEFRVWRTQLRIEEAKKLLLKYPDLSISKVGHSVGISDRSNFQKKFIELVGISPKGWRIKNLQK